MHCAGQGQTKEALERPLVRRPLPGGWCGCPDIVLPEIHGRRSVKHQHEWQRLSCTCNVEIRPTWLHGRSGRMLRFRQWRVLCKWGSSRTKGTLVRGCGCFDCLSQLLGHRAGDKSTNHVPCKDASHASIRLAQNCHPAHSDCRNDGIWDLRLRHLFACSEEQLRFSGVVEQNAQMLDCQG